MYCVEHIFNVIVLVLLIVSLQKTTGFANEYRCNETTTRHLGNCDGTAWSCDGICGQHQALPCSCDEHCVIYRNCCEDFKDECPNVFLKSSQKWKRYLTVDVKCQDDAREILISGCPNTTLDLDLYQRCTRDDPKSFDDIVPVTDISSRLQFKNIHCHECNVKNGAARKWTGNLTLNKRKIKIDPKTLKDFLFLMKTSSITVVWVNPSSEVNRPCLEQKNNPCDVCPNSLQQKLCSSVMSYFVMYDTNHTYVYQNRHCAACDNKQNMSCLPPMLTDLILSQRTRYLMFVEFDSSQDSWTFKVTEWMFLWTVMRCRRNSPACYSTKCSPRYPLINSSCSPRIIYLVVEIRVKIEDSNNKRAMTTATRDLIIHNIIMFKSYFNSSFEWQVKDWSSEVPQWDFVMELITMKKRTDMFPKTLNSSMHALSSNLRNVLRHESFDGTMDVCLLQRYNRLRRAPFGFCYSQSVLKIKLGDEVRTNTGTQHASNSISISLYTILISLLFCTSYLYPYCPV